jgi:hypothetical protein
MAWAYFQNQAALDGYQNAVCADQAIPHAGYNQASGAAAILDCWTDAFVAPIQLRGQGNVRTWAAQIPDAHVAQYDPVLGITVPDSAVVFGVAANGLPDGTVTVQGTTYTLEPNTLTYKKTKPATWTDPHTGKKYDTATGAEVP